VSTLREVQSDIGAYSRTLLPAQSLRPYQLEVAREIAGSVGQGGEQFAVVFSRQAGKDETLAQTLAYVLTRYRLRGGSAVVVSPTLRPQGMFTRRRLLERLGNPLTDALVRTEGNAVVVGRARCAFLSAAPGANARGETASLLLVCNEAQDVDPARWDAVFDPMAASTNATTVFLGTVWTPRTLLARQVRHLHALEAEDGKQRVFRVTWERVTQDVPAYGERVRARIHQLGQTHPFIRTEYFLEELSGESGLFPLAVRERMRGTHPARRSPDGHGVYALLIDVGGEQRKDGSADDGAEEQEPDPRRDATALTIVAVVTSTITDPGLLAPTYRVVGRRSWTGVGQPELLRAILDLALLWEPKRVVIDATGLGAGLAAFLARRLGPKVVVTFVFSQKSKSDLGWRFLDLCSAGRFRDHAPNNSPEQALFWAQVEECEYQVAPGANRLMRWGVSGRTHDDLLLSAALCAELDACDWSRRVARCRARSED
jgi:hypothetical protein